MVNAGWGTIGKLGILASIAVGVILTMRSVYYNWWRSGMNWNRFNFGSYSATAGGDTVYEHDVRAFDKLYDDTSAEVSHIESQAKREARKAYAAGKKVYGAATKVVDSAVSQAQAGLNASATKKTQH